MDCEKFEATLIDELYDELDELTSAAAKRHVAGCARCSALFNGLKATRRLAVLPMVTVPEGLEDRILAAARDAQKVVPIERRLSRAISWAGSWAMRPQTAMAAVFLLTIGFSALYLRGRAASTAQSGSMTITAEGSPAAAPAVAAADESKVDPTSAAAAHGVAAIPPAAAPAAAASAVAMGPTPTPTTSPSTPGDLDRDETTKGFGAIAQNGNGIGRARAAYGTSSGGGMAGGLGSDEQMNANAPAAGAPMHHAAPSPPPPPAEVAVTGKSIADPMSTGSIVTTKAEKQAGPTALDAAIAQFNAGNYDDATRSFDALAPSDPTAALWAARSVREGQAGCAAAVPRFDQVANRSFGTRVGYDAVFEGGACLRQLGSNEQARLHFARLLTVPSYVSRAQAAIAAIDSASQSQVAARAKAPAKPKAAQAQFAPPAPAPSAAAPSQQRPPSQAPTAVDQQQQAAPKATGF